MKLIKELISILVLIVIIQNQTVFAVDSTQVKIYNEQRSAALDSGLNTINNTIAAYVGGDKKEAKVTFNLSLGTDQDNIFNVSVSGAIDDKNPTVILGDLSGLTNKTKLTFSWQRNSLKEPLASNKKAFEQQQNICKAYVNNSDTKYDEDECDLSLFIGDKGGQYEKLFLNTLFPKSGGNFSLDYYGIDGTVASKKYKFTNTDDLNETFNESESDFSLNIYYGRVFSSTGMLEAGFRYENSFSDQNSQEICSPINGAEGFTTCRTLAVGAPKESTKKIVFATYRKLLNRYALDFSVYHDLENEETGVQLPIWMLQNPDGAFSGGIQFDWTSEKDELSAMFFVNKPFSGLF